MYSKTLRLGLISILLLSLLASCTAPLRTDASSFEARLREGSAFAITRWFCRSNNELLATADDGSEEYLLSFTVDKSGYLEKMKLCCDLEQTDKEKFLSDIAFFCLAFNNRPLDEKVHTEIKKTSIGRSKEGYCKAKDALCEYGILFIGTTAVFTVAPISVIYQSSLSISSG